MTRCISLWSPWSSLWLTERKVDETRHWPTRYCGPLLVHAAKKREPVEQDSALDRICTDEFTSNWREFLPRGAIIGIVNLVDCLPTDALHVEGDNAVCGNFEPGRYAWRRGKLHGVPSAVSSDWPSGSLQR